MLSFFNFGRYTDEDNDGKEELVNNANPATSNRKRTRPLAAEWSEEEDAAEEEPELTPALVREQKRRRVTKPVAVSAESSTTEGRYPITHGSFPERVPSPTTSERSSDLPLFDMMKEAYDSTDTGLGIGGTVTFIQCMDFMCHKNMVVKLSEKVNFITGPNGSGKSAVIAALQICLGLRASATKRAADLRGLIRHGCKGHATLRVGLRNVGPYAFKPELYGEEIVVERKLHRQGGSGYRLLRGSTMKVVSKLKRDLLEIIENFGIFVDNPCCILDQESSKEFLKGGARAKYHLFLKATELERLRRNLCSERSLRDMAKSELKANAAVIPLLTRDLKRAQSQLRALSTLQILQEKLSVVRKELVWARVAECEDEFQAAGKAQQAELKKFLKAEKKLKAAEEETRVFRKKEVGLIAEAKRLEKVIDDVKEEISERAETLQKKQVQKGKMERVVNDRRRQLRAYNGQRKQLETRLESLHAKAKRSAVDDQRQKNLEEIKLVSAQKADIERKAAKVGSTIANVSAEKEKKLDALEAARDQVKRAKAGRVEAEKELKGLESTKSNRVARFGPWMPKLLQRIEDNRDRFHRKPIHIGLSVKLTKPDFWRPVEGCLNRQLQRFLVSDHHDRTELRRLAKSSGLKRPPDMIMMRFLDQKHDVIQVPGHTVMTSALTIPDVNVFNALVDMCSIERHVLTRHSSDAMQKAFLGPVGKKRMPNGVLACWDMKGNKFSVRGGSEAKEASRNLAAKHPRYFFEDVTQEELDEAKQRVDDAVHELQQANDHLQLAKAAVKDSERRVKELEATQTQSVELQSQLEESLHKLRQQQNDLANDNATIAIADVNDNLEALAETIAAQERCVTEAKRAVEQFTRQNVVPVEKDILRLKHRNASLDAKCEQVMANNDSFNEALELCLARENQAKRKHAKYKEKHEAAVEKTEKARGIYTRSEQAALEFCHGERVRRKGLASAEVLNKRLQATARQVEEERKKQASHTSPEELITRAKAHVIRCKAQLERTVRNERIVRQRLRNLKKACSHRFHRWKEFKSSSMLWTASSFSKNLSQRGHEGAVIFDDEREEIRFKWKKSARDQDSNEADTDTKQLSGGEKTFTTLALLIAIGQVMETPFRVMDEFDVFMDNANRAESMRMLVEMARDSGLTTKQYIFLTPHDVSMLIEEKDVKVQMLPKVV